MDTNVNGSYANSAFGSTAGLSAASTSPAANVAGSPSSTSTPAAGASLGIKRRAPIACRRCRRMRSKCIHDKATPPCKSCGEAGLGAEDCIFVSRGQPDQDRDYRHPRTRAERPKGAAARAKRAEGTPALPTDPWEDLPPLEDLIDGVNRFTRYYFQLGFLAKKQYPEKLRKDHRSCNLFLLLSILSISARLSPALRVRYGNGVKAAEFFMERASAMTLDEIYAEPTLERCQAFYLLSIAQQGSGLRNKSYINMGVAIRMATLMMLHREETYKLTHKTPETIMAAESARRTIWMLYSQDNLHSGPLSPVSLSASDISTLLPCDEEDFGRGIEPTSRAALDGTPSAREHPHLISDKNRSLFATLMQVHHFWGFVGRRAVYHSHKDFPWQPESEYQGMATHLAQWEGGLPPSHLYSAELLRRYKGVGEDLAYLCVTMMTRLCNIVLRRPYFIDLVKKEEKTRLHPQFYSRLALDLFRNVRSLYEQIDAQFTDRTPDESVGAQIASFCVYSCGLFSSYLCKYPNICPDPVISKAGPAMLQRTIAILNESKEVWPLAARWADGLEKLSDPASMPPDKEESMDDGRDPVPRAIGPLPPPISKSAATVAAAAARPERALPLPGTQPGSASSTTLSSPHNGHVLARVPNAHVQHSPPPSFPSNYHYGNQMSQAQSPPVQQSPSLQHQASAPSQMHYGSPNQNQNQHQFGHHHQHQAYDHSPTPPHLRSMPTPTYFPVASTLSQQQNMSGASGAGSIPRWAPAEMGRQPDTLSMTIDPLNNQPQQQPPLQQPPQGFMPPLQHAMMMGQTDATATMGLFPTPLVLQDGFENELYFLLDGGQGGASMVPPTDQWTGPSMYT